MSKRNFTALAEAHGIDVEYVPSEGPSWPAILTLWAPEGKVFAGVDAHCDASMNGLLTATGAVDWAAALSGLREIVSTGFSDCPDRPFCDVCNPGH